MEVKEKYIKKYWHEIVRDQITDELQEEGFKVYADHSIDGFTADLYAEKGEDKKIIEIKSKALSREDFIKLHKFATRYNIKFQLAIADFRSLKPSINIEGIEKLLVDYMNDHGLCEDLGYGSYVDDITDVSYNVIDIDEGAILLKGEAVCEICIEFNNEGDCDFNANFPMKFDIQIDTKDWKIDDTEAEIEVDTSSFYE